MITTAELTVRRAGPVGRRVRWVRGVWGVRRARRVRWALWAVAAAVSAAVLAVGPVAGSGAAAARGAGVVLRGPQVRVGCAGARCWPVTGAGVRGRPEVLRGFDPPAAPWAPGHRGVDLRAGPGAPVRAAAPGTVAFTGAVAGTPVVVVRLPGGLRTTYEPVRATLPVGTAVAAGTTVGMLAGSLPHCGRGCLHWGLLLGPAYLDPLSLLPEALRHAGPSRLLPLTCPLGTRCREAPDGRLPR